MTKADKFIINAKFKHGHPSAMSNSAWLDLNKGCTVLKLHIMCHNPKLNCQEQIFFNPEKYMLEGARFKNTMKIFLRDPNCLD